MADVKLRMEVNPNAETETLGNIVNDSGASNLSNVSYDINASNVFVGLENTKPRGRKMLSLVSGELRFNSEGVLDGVLASESEPDMFVWGAVPSTGKYSVKLTFTNATALKDIVVYGDPTTQQFPTRAIVDGTREITSNDNRWAINLGAESTTHTIEFTDWSRPNYNACLTNIMVMLRYYEIGIRNGLKNVDSISQSTGQPKEVHYGVIANSGSANVVDVDGEILDMISDGIISRANVPVDIFANGKKIQSHIITDSEYSADGVFNVQLSNDLSRLDLNYNGYKNIDTPCSLYDLIVAVFQSLDVSKYTTEYIDNTLLGAELKAHTSSIRYVTPYISYATYREVIDNICAVAQMQLMFDDDGNARFVNAKANYNPSTQPIVVPANRQQGLPQKDIILKNTIEMVEYNPAQLVEEKNTVIESETINPDALEFALQNAPTIVQYDYNKATVDGKVVIQGARVEGYVVSGTFEILKRPNIQYVIPEVKCELQCTVSLDLQVPASLYIEEENPQAKWENTQKSLYSYGANFPEVSADFEEFFDGTTLLYNSIEDNTYKSLTISHPHSIQFIEEDDRYVVSYDFLSYLTKYHVKAQGTETTLVEGEQRLVNSVQFAINGDVVKIQFRDENVRTGELSSKNVLVIDQNELFQTTTKIGSLPLSSVLAENILQTHKNGVATCRLTIQCGDMYYADGTKAKDWSMGQVLQVNDVVRIDKDNKGTSQYKDNNGNATLWRVTGRTFHYEGVPTIDLELQEIT